VKNQNRPFPYPRIALAFLAIAPLAACAEAPDSTSEALGTVVAEIRLAPPDARCLQVKVVGTATVTQSFDVVPEETSVLTLRNLPVGNLTVSATAFNVACSAVAATTVATYVADPVMVTVMPPAPVTLTLLMRPAAITGNATVEFPTRAQVTEFTLNGMSGPSGITSGPDGNLWFGELNFTRVGRLTPTLTFTDLPGLSAGAGVTGIAAGPDGNIWAAENGNGKIARITPSGTIVEFSLAADSVPHAPVAATDGNIWFLDNGRISRITPWGAVTNFPAPAASPGFMTACTDGNLWFTAEEPSLVGRITTAGVVTSWPQTFEPGAITCTPDGRVWVVEAQAGQIAQGTITAGFATGVVHVATGVASIQDLATGPDGGAWFVSLVGVIGRVSPFAAWATPRPNSGASALTVGPDGAFWFTESNGTSAAIGRLQP
jgi:virginiamycin B lyase